MNTVPGDLLERLRKFDQDHVLEHWDSLSPAERRILVEQLQAIDLEQLRLLYAERDQVGAPPSAERIAPIPVDKLGLHDGARRSAGTETLRRGEVAALVVAGGQGSRLGFDHPKGMFPIGPVTSKSLFAIHAEKALALKRRYGAPLPLLVMTSPATHEETLTFFRDNAFFGLPKEEVFFFCQGTMSALDLATGKLLRESEGRLFLSPNGHGGTLTALADSGLLERLNARGIRQIFYFQVDNPLVKVADPLFLGHHILANAEVSSKIVPKNGPNDRLGNMVLIDGRCSMIEYSDLPEELAKQTDSQGRLRIWAGSPAIHIFSVEFLERVTQGPLQMPFHIARKKVAHLKDPQPQKENALKFERFIFDVLPMAERWTVVETSRHEEFHPLKNASGVDSPEDVRQAISNLAGDWFEHAGIALSRKDNGDASMPLEISPLFALDEEEFKTRVDRAMPIHGPLYLGPDFK
jgi:UDP-N-acetylglucosamine/UDP-N-acetylgalactosamine diphosphorylase